MDTENAELSDGKKGRHDAWLYAIYLKLLPPCTLLHSVRRQDFSKDQSDASIILLFTNFCCLEFA